MIRARRILGLNYGGHDTSAAIVADGEVIAAIEEERFTREKHSRAFPIQAVAECLRLAGLSIGEIDEVAMSAVPLRLIRELYLRRALEDSRRIPFLCRDAERVLDMYFTRNLVKEKLGYSGPVRFYHHHMCHLASAYYLSGFEDACLASYDGNGEIECSVIGHTDGGRMKIDDRVDYPHSLGLLYSAMTFYLGFKHHSDEGTVMSLASFGRPETRIPQDGRSYMDVFREIAYPVSETRFRIDESWIAYHYVRDTWVSEKFRRLFGPPRAKDEPLTEQHAHIAGALQRRLEEIVLGQVRYLKRRYGFENLCLAGGVALNCVMNGKILESGLFKDVFVQPGAGDNGGAVGACLMAYYGNRPGSVGRRQRHIYLGAAYSDDEIREVASEAGALWCETDQYIQVVAQILADGYIVGWYQGRMEFGPRALGNRSILTPPFPASMKDYLNDRVKFRETFRPFAPAVLAHRVRDYFQTSESLPYMLFSVPVREDKREAIAATVHVDGSCRVQTVERETNPAFFDLIAEFEKITGVPVLLNTSFNIKGEPIVNTPREAMNCFMKTNIDALVMNRCIVYKAEVGERLRQLLETYGSRSMAGRAPSGRPGPSRKS